MSTTRKSVIFDIDGTICDAQHRKVKAYSQCLEYLRDSFPNLKEEISHELFNKITNVQFSIFRLNEKNDVNIRFTMLLSFLEVKIENINAHLPELNRIYWENLGELKFFPKMRDLFELITRHGSIYYLFTDSSTEEAEFKLKRFPSDYFPENPRVFVTDNNSRNTRITPLGMEKNADAYRFLKDEYDAFIMIGDSPDFDIIPAREAGLEALDVNQIPHESMCHRVEELLNHR